MNKNVTKTATRLAEPDQAIEQLLDTLLAEVPEHIEHEPEAASASASASARPVSGASPVDQDVVLNIASSAPIEKVRNTPIPAAESVLAKKQPKWAEGEFKVLLFRLGDQRMGVPLICLNSIARLSQHGPPLQLPAQPDWHKGVLEYRGSKLVLVDLIARLQLRSRPVDAQFVLAIGDDGFGLVCDAIEEPVAVVAADVKWRVSRDSRRWMLGMLREQMCVLIDPETIAGELQ